MLAVVVGRARVVAEIEAGEAAGAGLEGAVVRVGEALQVENGEPFAVMQPVEHHGEFFVVHPVAGEGDVFRPGGRVLPQVAFPALLVHVEDRVGGAERVQDGPVAQVFDGVVGTVVAAPPHDALQVAALVEILVEERGAGDGVLVEEFAFEQGPRRRSHRRFDGDRRMRRRAARERWRRRRRAARATSAAVGRVTMFRRAAGLTPAVFESHWSAVEDRWRKAAARRKCRLVVKRSAS